MRVSSSGNLSGGASRKLVVGHVLGEIYYMTTGRMSRAEAHKASGRGEYKIESFYFVDKKGNNINKHFGWQK